MARINPVVVQWIQQLADADQAVAFYAYQSLQEEAFAVGRPGQEEAQAALAAGLGKELIAEASTGEGGGLASVRENAFLAAAATNAPNPKHPARVRTMLARLMGYIPHPAAVPFLAKALNDLEAREMARQSLECNPSEQATDALIAALDLAGAEFCCGVVNSLAKRRSVRVAPALLKAAGDRQDEVRVAALYALAEFPEPAHDSVLEKATRAHSDAERRAAHIARVRLAGTLRAAGNKAAAERIERAVLAERCPGIAERGLAATR